MWAFNENYQQHHYTGDIPYCTCSHPPCLDQSPCSSPPLCTAYHCLVQPSFSEQLQYRQTHAMTHIASHNKLDKRITAHIHPQFILQKCANEMSSNIPANEEVRTTLLMVPLYLATLSRTVDVPLSAGSTSSFCVSSHDAKKGDAM